ncbi:MAG TPA: VOC family protein [Burkholderiales bacterium]|jgi:lactoylglutathione lyase|nr:VOC family protein [Burkholderiales bacterium]
MNRIVHLALKVENLEKATEFYEKVFGFRQVETKKTRDHTSRHMTDGNLDFTLMKYDEGTRSAESLAAGENPCIHHFAVEVDDVDARVADLRKYGCEIVSDPGVIPVKFRAPDGIVAEIVPARRYKKAAPGR